MTEPPHAIDAQDRTGRLARHLAALRRLHDPTPPIRDPLALIVWDTVGYLIPDGRRQALFDELVDRIGPTAPGLTAPGLTAQGLVDAPHDILFDIARRGGMRPEDRVERLRAIGRLALGLGGDLGAALRSAPPSRARALLKRFPGVADPGADKILLFAGIDIRPALESNGVRAMVRLGHAVEGSSYAHAYRSATAALRDLGPPDRDRLIEAFQLLRAHGQTLCKRAAPICLSCPLDMDCAHIPTRSL